MKKTEMMYEGKAKKVWATDDPDCVIVEYKDDATPLPAMVPFLRPLHAVASS